MSRDEIASDIKLVMIMLNKEQYRFLDGYSGDGIYLLISKTAFSVFFFSPHSHFGSTRCHFQNNCITHRSRIFLFSRVNQTGPVNI